jgi:beta-phosphoglucomutase-like phosphatase (HAD superfamily)
MPGKPAPAVFLAIADVLKVPPTQCLVIEDAMAGVEAAQRASMKCLAVTTTNPPEVLAFADRVVDDLSTVTLPDLVTMMAK